MTRDSLKIIGLTLGFGGLIGIGLALAPDRGGWKRVCTAEHTDTGLSVVPRGAGGVPIGGGLSLQIEDDTVCDRYAWTCPAGKACDPAKKPRR